jgi:DNA-binding Xre family transcriptional regulator
MKGESMRETRINWKEIKILMAKKEIETFAELAVRAGVHKNTLNRRKTSFISTTVDRLAAHLDCDPVALITSIEVSE